MALINCPECGKEISDQVEACPHCGYPIMKQTIQPKATVDKKKLKVVGAAVAAVAAVAIIGGTVAYNSQPSTRYKKAESAYNNGNYEKALKYYTLAGDYLDSADKAEQAQIGVNYQDAISLMGSGNYAEAATLLEDLGDYEDAASMLETCEYNIGLSYMESSDYENALLAFQKASNIDDANEQAYEALHQLVEAGEYEKAVTLSEDIRNASSDEYVHYAKGQVNLAEGNYQESAKQFTLAKDVLDAENMITEVKYQRGQALFDEESYEDAEEVFEGIIDYKDSETLKNNSIFMEAKKAFDDGSLNSVLNPLKDLPDDFEYEGTKVSDLKTQLSENQQWVDIAGRWATVSGKISTDCTHTLSGRSQGEWYRDIDKGDYSFVVTCKLLDNGKAQVSFYLEVPMFINWSVLSSLVTDSTHTLRFDKELSASDLGTTFEMDDYTTVTFGADSIQINYKMVEDNKDAYFNYTYKTNMTFNHI